MRFSFLNNNFNQLISVKERIVSPNSYMKKFGPYLFSSFFNSSYEFSEQM